MDSVFAARTTFYQPFTGQLKLALYVDSDMLSVHVIQGRHLWHDPTVDAAQLRTHVKLSLMPDTLMKTFCKTESIYGRDTPHFNQRFTFELQSSDYSKRLLLSAWQCDGRQSHLLGCMSFGLRRLASARRVVNGWFYLLTSEVGRSKHLRAKDEQQNDKEEMGGLSALMRMERHKLLVQRSASGFGFSIVGSSPVSVSRVSEGSDAQTVGLKVRDVLFRVNGENVLRSSSEAVARIIKTITDVMLLDIYRPRALSPEEVLPQPPQEMSPWRPRKRVFNMSSMRAPRVPAVFPSTERRTIAEPQRKRARRDVRPQPVCYDNFGFNENGAPEVDNEIQAEGFVRQGAARVGIIRKRDSVRRNNRVSFAETVMYQSILKVEDLCDEFNSSDFMRD